MKFRLVGRSGLRVSVLGLGGNQFGATVDEESTKAIVDAAQRLGVNFIDTADVYGKGLSEEFLGKALRGRRDEFVIATKTGSSSLPPGRLSRRQLIISLEASLRRLGTDRVDLYYLHFPDPGTPMEESLEALDDLRRAGKVIYPAISNHSGWQVAKVVGLCLQHNWMPPAASQNLYNMLDRGVEAELLPACADLGVGMVPYYPLAGGFLTGKHKPGAQTPADVRVPINRLSEETWLTAGNFSAIERFATFARERGHTAGELAIAWLLGHPQVSSVIAGARRPEQLVENARAVAWELSPTERTAI